MNGVSAVVSALYTTGAGRLLGPREYGSFTTLLALIGLLLLLLASIESGVTKLAAEYKARGALGRTLTLVKVAGVRCAIGMGVAAALFVPFIPSATRALNLEHQSELGVFVVYVVVWLFTSIVRGVQRGEERFSELGLGVVVESLVRASFGLTVIYLGFGAAGGMAGYTAGMAACLLLGRFQLRDVLTREAQPAEPERLLTLSGNLVFLYAYPMVLTSFDMLVAKRVLSGNDAGLYGACSTLARLIFVAGTPLLQVIFSRVSALRAEGQPVRKLVWQVNLVMAGLLALSYVVPHFAGELLLQLLYGDAYQGSADPLRVMWLTVALLLVQHMLALILVAADRTRGSWTLVLPCVLHVALLWKYHASGTQVALCGLMAAVTGVLPLLYMRLKKPQSSP